MRRHNIMDHLPPHKDAGSDSQNDFLYRLNALKAVLGVEVTEPTKEVYLAVHRDAPSVTLSFAAFERVAEGANGVEMRLLFTGEGSAVTCERCGTSGGGKTDTCCICPSARPSLFWLH